MRAAVSTIIAGLFLCLRVPGTATRSIHGPSDGVDQLILGGDAAGSWPGVFEPETGRTSEAEKSEVVKLQAFPEHQLRVTNTKSALCDTSIKQHSGYLDISDGRHLFYWFFEARRDPENAPLMLWLNGGPGCSSIASGLLFEHGPCFVAEGGNGTVHNPHAWNEFVNIIYLDEPIGTGYSYASDGSKHTGRPDRGCLCLLGHLPQETSAVCFCAVPSRR